MIPNKYGTVPIGQFVSLSPSDIATGKAYVRTYGIATRNLAAYKLGFLVVQSDQVRTASTSNFEVNFDLNFELTYIIEGELYVNWLLEAGTSTTNTSTIKIFQVQGGVETQLGATVSGRALTANTSYRNLSNFTIPRTTFKRDDILRIEIIVTTTGAGGSTLWHDPSNNNTPTNNEIDTLAKGPTTLLADIPFKVL